jgi:O-antigen/teichoic acid export membrane protein
MVNQRKGGVLLSYIQMVLNVLVKFIYTPFLLRELGQQEYGLYSLVISIVGYMTILDFGFGNAVTRYTVKYNAEDDKDSLYKLWGTFSVLYIIIGFLAMIICMGINMGAESLFGNSMSDYEVSRIRIMIVLCGINLLFSFPLQISPSILVAYERFIFKNAINVIKIILQPIILLLLLYLFHIKAVGAIVVVTCFNLLTYLVYYLYTVSRLGFKFSINRFDSSLVKTILGFSLWMFLLTIFEQLQFNSGQFILGMHLGAETVAIWGITMIFVLNFRSISTAITNVYMPSYMNLVFIDATNELHILTNKMVRLQSFVIFTVLANFILFGKDFIQLWAGDTYSDSFFPALIVMVAMSCSLLLDFTYLTQMARNDLKYRVFSLFGCLILSYIVVVFLMGYSLISFSVFMSLSFITGQVIAMIIYLKRNTTYNISDILGNIIKVLAVPGSLVAVFTLLRHIYPFLLGYMTVTKFIVCILVYNVILLALYWLLSFNQNEKGMIKKFLR